MLVAQPTLHSLQRSSKKEVPEARRGQMLHRHSRRKHAAGGCDILSGYLGTQMRLRLL
jgi:hypothetical protein